MVTPEAYLSLFGEIPSFQRKLATMRKYEISCDIILQSLSQIKKMYEKDWASVLGNCSTLIYLGCPETETHEYMCKLLGKTTITVRNRSTSNGGKGGSLSYNQTQRDLMTVEEIENLPPDECIVKIMSINPFRDKKHDYVSHKFYPLTGDADPNNNFVFICESDEVNNAEENNDSINVADKNHNDVTEKEIKGSQKIYNEDELPFESSPIENVVATDTVKKQDDNLSAKKRVQDEMTAAMAAAMFDEVLMSDVLDPKNTTISLDEYSLNNEEVLPEPPDESLMSDSFIFDVVGKDDESSSVNTSSSVTHF